MEIYINFDLNVMTIEITLVLPLYLKESVFQWSFSLSTCSWNPMVASFPDVMGPRAFQVFLQFSHLVIFELSLHLLVLVALLLLILYSFVHNPASTYTRAWWFRKISWKVPAFWNMAAVTVIRMLGYMGIPSCTALTCRCCNLGVENSKQFLKTPHPQKQV